MKDQWNSVDDALTWAHRVSACDILKLSILGKMRGAERSPSDATPHEQHAQAAQIMGHATRLPLIGQAYVYARYMPSRADRSGQIEEGYGRAMQMLVEAIPAPEDKQRRAVHIEALQYFEGGGSRNFQGIRWVRAELQVRTAAALQHRRETWDVLDGIQRQAFGALETSLSEAGLLRSPADAETRPSPAPRSRQPDRLPA